jgi:serine/threonine protein phosphatase PrpC
MHNEEASSSIMAEDAHIQRRAVVSSLLEVEPFDPFSSRVALEIGAASVRGTLRPHNTDHYLAIKISRGLETVRTSLAETDYPAAFEEHAYAMIVADGIGSHGEGAHASRVALSALAHLAITHGHWNVRVGSQAAEDIRIQIQFFFHRVDDALRRAGRAFPNTGLATSLTMAAVAGKDLFFTSVGHSKAFLFRSGRLIQLTTNHTREAKGSDALPPSELGHAKRDLKHVVTKTVGGEPGDADVDIEQIQLMHGDRLLLCTNGLTDGVSEDEIADALAVRRSPEEDCRQLVDLAALSGTYDDMTAMVANYALDSEPRSNPLARPQR